MKLNTKTFTKLLLVLIVISSLVLLTGCAETPEEGVIDGFSALFIGLGGGLLGLLQAIIDVIEAVIFTIGAVLDDIETIHMGYADLIYEMGLRDVTISYTNGEKVFLRFSEEN